MEKKKSNGDKYLFDLAIFLATSASGCVEEPHLYGPFRLIDALSRLIELPKYATCIKEDPFLTKMKSVIDEKKFLVVSDTEAFKAFLDSLVREFAKELKRRSLERRKRTG
ncbi:MAG: DUF6092 family protein [Candidatus Bathyarchaeota archaeon]|jgi:hypothetical protein|nr:DUF6092 family protein [Candidatus Bathyarchaeota archaeon]MDH5746643.1 DUF6092 family protein [Candidatus Bathyarchaeota archaeon]